MRRACYLYEALTGNMLEGRRVTAGAYVDLHDRDRFVTSDAGTRSAKWRLRDNGLGPAGEFSPIVRRTRRLDEYMSRDLFVALDAFSQRARELGLLDRALDWAYLAETQKSFEIERETPSPDKQHRFVELLAQAHKRRPLDEPYLVELQNAAISNPFDLAPGYRTQQNDLVRGGHGAPAVRYVPPPPAMVHPLMDALAVFANSDRLVNPVVKASPVSFGFVFVHPFMDGNGRLSRFLFHHALWRAGVLDNGLLLPVSVVMKNNERGYLAALESFSLPARRAWDVTCVAPDDCQADFRGNGLMYSHFDATRQVEFGFECAWAAIDEHLDREVDFLARFDRIREHIDARHDVRGTVLQHLIVSALQHGGTISRNLRRKYADLVPPTVFDAVELEAGASLQADVRPQPSPSRTRPA